MGCNRVSLLVFTLLLSAFCHHFHASRETNDIENSRKGSKKYALHLKTDSQGRRGGRGGGEKDVGGVSKGENPMLLCRSRSDPPLSFLLFLFILPPVCVMHRRRNCINSTMASHSKSLSVAARPPSAGMSPRAAQVLMNCRHPPHFSPQPSHRQTH